MIDQRKFNRNNSQSKQCLSKLSMDSELDNSKSDI